MSAAGFRVILLVAGAGLAACGASGKEVPQLVVPAGFSIAVWADDVPDARSLALGEKGTVFVGSRGAGTVRALADRDGDGKAEERHVVAEDLDAPNGVAVLDGALFVGEPGRILRYDDIEARLARPPGPKTVREGLPDGGGHRFRYLGFGPDRKLYVGLGVACNVCEVEHFVADGRALETASITRMDPDGGNWEPVATGVRNTVGFTWHPKTGELWFTDNGRDNLGDDRPSCELNRLDRPVKSFGFPWCHQGDIPDPQFGAGHSCGEAVPPVARLGPHVAPLGVRFYTGTQFPEAWRGAAIVAEHGSWNRSKKVGYRVVAVHVDGPGNPAQEVLIGGWLKDEKVSGRPVDVLQMPDGSLLISDDAGGRIWRLAYGRS